MKRLRYFHLTIVCSVSLLLGGCVIKPARVPTRHFVLAPIARPEYALTPGQPLAVEVGFVKMPSYLLRDSTVVRKSAEEVDYLETALWAERLDQSFRHTLAQNLGVVLASGGAALPDCEGDRVLMRVSVDVQQFDVDTEGQGTLLATWRLTVAGADKPMKVGQVHLTRPGPSPRGNPQAIAGTLSALLVEFSHDLAQTVRESARAKQ